MSAPGSREPQEIVVLRDALKYEYVMLIGTFERLQTPPPDQLVVNALIESFCIHARQMIDFFENEQGARAERFVSGYKAQFTPKIAKALREKLNCQIAHITYRRTTVAGDKIGPSDREELRNALVNETMFFLGALDPRDRAIVDIPGLPATTVAVSQSAAGPSSQIQIASTSAKKFP